MLSFDPAKVEKIPYEDEIRAWIEELKAEKAAREREEAEKNEAGQGENG